MNFTQMTVSSFVMQVLAKKFLDSTNISIDIELLSAALGKHNASLYQIIQIT